MREKINVIGTETTNENELNLLVSNVGSYDSLKPMGQMLVDSDEVSFVYLLEKETEYTYVIINEDNWQKLKWAIENNAIISLSNGSDKIELVDFLDELNYLIENIKGNSNYGEAMVTKVEAIF